MQYSKEIIIPNWGTGGGDKLRASNFKLLDTTLRDGVQMPTLTQPKIEDKKRIIDANARVGIEAMDICLPGDLNTPYFQEGVECARYMKEKYPGMEIVVLTPTKLENVEATLEFARQAGVKLSPILFRGSSDIRMAAEDWTREQILEGFYEYSKILTENGHKVTCATEDSTRTGGVFLRDIFAAARLGGAQEFCVADTVGWADPEEVANQIQWVKKEVVGGRNLNIQFHGHDDLHNAVSNTIAALKAGANMAHVTWLSAGERGGNASVEGILGNLEKHGANKYDLSAVVDAARLVSRAVNRPIPINQPLVGEIVYTSSSGIHAAAIHKASEKGLTDIEGIVYAPIDPKKTGRENVITIGPLGGAHSVAWVLGKMGEETTQERVDALLKHARIKNAELTPPEINRVLRELDRKTSNLE